MYEFVLEEKALDFAKQLGIKQDDFSASRGWLHRWKVRQNFTDHVVSGESNSVSQDMMVSWSETKLPTILKNYELENIFNADEFGLFYQQLPSRSLSIKGEECLVAKDRKFV